ncbi:hypothetical protein HU830_00315 [Lactobacillus sp. DCY120]|uniref:Integral membrane protein n=1 Tax=Bombilactobacillus apium TaxID=2675299 RepID=A0A850R4Z1_9LACO|nr:hypothetical protein [Bombilactobacillus apium]NVY95652.1 hypothetical protein [Bombilactobacillus apium]
MLIKLLIALFILILFILGTFLLFNREQPFFIYQPHNLKAIQRLMTITACLLIIVGIIGIIILFIGSLELNLITLVAGSLIVGLFAVFIACWG